MKRGLLICALSVLTMLSVASAAYANLDAGYTAHRTASVGDCNNNGISDIAESNWGNRDDDGDGVCNNVDFCPYEADPANASTDCQMQAIAVPESPSDPSVPHPTYSGASITLEGIARYGGDQFMWDFGDGLSTGWQGIANPYDLSVAHVYTGAVGHLFSATLSVRSLARPADVATSSYPVKIFAGTGAIPSDPAQLDVRARMAADKALWYLHRNATRSQFSDGVPGYRQPYETWVGGDFFTTTTCAAVDALEHSGNLPQGSYDTDPYVEDVQRGLAAILATSNTVSLNPAFDTNGDTFGVMLNAPGQSTGLTFNSSCALALADSRAAGRIAAAGEPGVYGKSYSVVGQDAIDWLSQSQLQSGNEQGTWPYASSQGYADIDTSLWPVLALQATQDAFGSTVPTAVRVNLSHWLVAQRHVGNDAAYGAWMIFNSYALPSVTAAGIAAHRFQGDAVQHPDVQAGLGFLYRDWADLGGTPIVPTLSSTCWTANLGNGSTMLAISRVLSAFSASRINDYDYTGHVQRAASFDWYYTPPGQFQQGYATNLVARQSADGSWVDTSGCNGASGPLSTAYGLSTLHNGPVADAGPAQTTDINQPVTFDASASYDPLPGQLTYAWDFDYDGTTFNVDGTGVSATKTGGYPTYTQTAAGGQVAAPYVVAVRVTDPAGQQAIATTTVQVKPLGAPIANIGGPYLGTVNAPVQFDASASSDSDGDPLTYAWDFHNNGQFADATGATPTTTFTAPGTYAICVKVTDHPDQNPIPYAGTPQSVQACTTVQVGAHAPTADAGGPYTGTAGSTVTLDGTGSSDPDGAALTYAWDLSATGLYNDSTAPKPAFSIPASALPGAAYNVCLRVRNASVTSPASCTTVTVVVQHVPPVCQIVTPFVFLTNTGSAMTITADGSRSSDPNGGALTFSWSSNGPAFANPSAAIATQVFNGAGAGAQVTWTNTLLVSNGFFTSSCTQNVQVTDNAAPSLTVPANIVLEANANTSSAVQNWVASATASDPAASPGTPIPIANDFQAGAGIGGIGVDNTVRVTWTAQNPYGGASAQRSATVTVVDTTPPVLTLPASFTAATATPSYTASAHDFVDGDVPVTCAPLSGSTFPLGETTVTCTAKDTHGNIATGSFVITVADTTPPVITPVVTGTLGLHGWYTSNVGLSWSITDPESGVSSRAGCADVTVSTDTNGTAFTCTATSGGGTASSTYTVLRDTTPPAITGVLTPAPNAAGWNKTDATASFDCTDSGSGVDACPAAVVFGHGANQHTVVAATDLAGNSRTYDVQNVNVDEVAPTLSGAPTTAPNANGWYRGDVTIHWLCADDLSGIAGGCPVNSTITGEGTALRATASVSDVARNSASSDSAPVKIDRTAPLTGASAPSGWSNAGVTVTLTATDNLSGVETTSWSLDGAPAQAGTSVAISAEGVHSLAYWSTDNAGNVELQKTITVRIDKTAPTIGHTLDPAPNAAGWNNTNVTVAFQCADALSGMASCTLAHLLSTEGSAQAVAGTALDNAGNSASDTVYVSIDKTPPTIAAAPDRSANANGWYANDVLVSFTCGDALSGVATCPSPVTVEEGKAQQAGGAATDVAGNSASATLAGLNVDKTPPVVTLTGGGVYTADQTVTITCNAVDALSGVASSTCPAAAVSAPAWTFGLGAVSRSATATDRAGNVGSGSVAFTVGVTCGSLKTLIGHWVTDAGVVAGLDAKVDSICTAPNANAKNGKLGAFDNQLQAQSGKSVTADRAKLLEQFAATL